MKKLQLSILILLTINILTAQELYFPPLIGPNWESLSPAELGWCEDKIPELYDLLDQGDSKAFILLKDGKIVLEKYFDDFTKDSVWYWASAGKSLTAFKVGIAQDQGYLDIEDLTSDYLGEGWTALPPDKEELITVRHQLTMTTGLNDFPFTDQSDCTLDTCLIYEADSGTRWAYHNAPYTLIEKVVENATGQAYNAFMFNEVSLKTGIYGLWIKLGYNNVFFSTARAMARFGLLVQNNGIWNNDTLIHDQVYINAMTSPSQDLNESYGYLWWLNGQESHMLPLTQFVFNGPLLSNAPADLFTGAGKNGQYVNVVPSQGLVLVRMGNNPDNTLVPVAFNDEIWQKLNEIVCTNSAYNKLINKGINVFPNPVHEALSFQNEPGATYSAKIYNSLGELAFKVENVVDHIYITQLPSGIYFMELTSYEKKGYSRFIKQ